MNKSKIRVETLIVYAADYEDYMAFQTRLYNLEKKEYWKVARDVYDGRGLDYCYAVLVKELDA